MAVCRPHLEIPSVAPALTNRALRSAFTVKQSRILLICIKMRRIDNPAKHVFTVSCLYPSLFYITKCNLIKDRFVLLSNLLNLFSFQIDSVNIIRNAHAVALGYQVLAYHSHGTVIMLPICKFLNITF